MRRKIRIFSSLAVVCLSVCMFAFGVYAATTVSVTTSGVVTFKATGVYATIIREVTGAVDANGDVITALEDRLIGAFAKPPCNAEVRVKSVKNAVRAFN